MTKKLNGKKASSMTLRDFYEQSPGTLPLSSCLPTKPGEHARTFENAGLDKALSGVKLSSARDFQHRRVSSAQSRSYGFACNGGSRVGYTAATGVTSDFDACGRAYEDVEYVGKKTHSDGYTAPSVDVEAVYRASKYPAAGSVSTELAAHPYHAGYPVSAVNPSAVPYAPDTTGERVTAPHEAPPPPPPRKPTQQVVPPSGHGLNGTGVAMPAYATDKGVATSARTQPGKKSSLIDLPPSVDGYSPFSAIRSTKQASVPTRMDQESNAPEQTATLNARDSRDVLSKPKDQAYAPVVTVTKPLASVAEQSELVGVQSPKGINTARNEQTAALKAPPTAVRNEWADKLVQSTLARLSNGKTTLVEAGTLAPVNGPTAAAEAGNSSAFVKPSHPFGRPRLALAPRSVTSVSTMSLTPSAGSSAPSETDSDRSIATPAPSAGPQDRPRLALQPRTLPLSAANQPREQESGRAKLKLQPRSKPAGSATVSVRNNVFGGARPREEVLRERGVEPNSFETERSGSNAAGGLSGASRPVSRSASITSGVSEDDAWHTVTGRKVRGSAASSVGRADSFGLEDDPFFGVARDVPMRTVVHPGHSRLSEAGSAHGSYSSATGMYLDTMYEEGGLSFKRELPKRRDFF